MDALIRRYWLPIWSLPSGERSVQRVLQYPVCQLVIGHDYSYLVGPRLGMSTKELAGNGWAMGVMLQPAAGALLTGRMMTTVVGHDLTLDSLLIDRGADIAVKVRSVLIEDPSDVQKQGAAVVLLEQWLSALLPVDEEGLLVNAIVDFVETKPEVHRVSQLCAEFSLTERTLQRLTGRRIGLTPKWLIQRRRLHEVAGRLADPARPSLADLALDLGYADQAHLHRDFRAVTGLTPAQYAAEPRQQSR